VKQYSVDIQLPSWPERRTAYVMAESEAAAEEKIWHFVEISLQKEEIRFEPFDWRNF